MSKPWRRYNMGRFFDELMTERGSPRAVDAPLRLSLVHRASGGEGDAGTQCHSWHARGPAGWHRRAPGGECHVTGRNGSAVATETDLSILATKDVARPAPGESAFDADVSPQTNPWRVGTMVACLADARGRAHVWMRFDNPAKAMSS